MSNEILNKLKDNYLKYLELEIDDIIGNGPYEYFNTKYSNLVLKNINETSFNCLYPNIIISLYHLGIIDKTEESNINIVKRYLKYKQDLKLNFDKKKHDYINNNRVFVNSYYSKLCYPYRKTKKSTIISQLVCDYQQIYFKELVENNPNIVYICIDFIIHDGNIIMNNDSYPYSLKIFPYFIIEKQRRYVYHDGLEIKVKGYIKNNKIEKENYLKSIIREINLSILNII